MAGSKSQARQHGSCDIVHAVLKSAAAWSRDCFSEGSDPRLRRWTLVQSEDCWSLAVLPAGAFTPTKKQRGKEEEETEDKKEMVWKSRRIAEWTNKSDVENQSIKSTDRIYCTSQSDWRVEVPHNNADPNTRRVRACQQISVGADDGVWADGLCPIWGLNFSKGANVAMCPVQRCRSRLVADMVRRYTTEPHFKTGWSKLMKTCNEILKRKRHKISQSKISTTASSTPGLTSVLVGLYTFV